MSSPGNPTNEESDMTPNEYAEKVVLHFIRNITDHVFLNIQSNEELMREYQTRVNENSLQSVNQAIGRKVKEMFQLENEELVEEVFGQGSEVHSTRILF
jgi:hypothetical protein